MQREGVCRELAHLGIALCRGLCIPARMVVGYLNKLEPMDFHAWFEAYCLTIPSQRRVYPIAVAASIRLAPPP